MTKWGGDGNQTALCRWFLDKFGAAAIFFVCATWFGHDAERRANVTPLFLGVLWNRSAPSSATPKRWLIKEVEMRATRDRILRKRTAKGRAQYTLRVEYSPNGECFLPDIAKARDDIWIGVKWLTLGFRRPPADVGTKLIYDAALVCSPARGRGSLRALRRRTREPRRYVRQGP